MTKSSARVFHDCADGCRGEGPGRRWCARHRAEVVRFARENSVAAATALYGATDVSIAKWAKQQGTPLSMQVKNMTGYTIGRRMESR